MRMITIFLEHSCTTLTASSTNQKRHVGCYGAFPDPLYNLDSKSGHKLLSGSAFQRSDNQAITECFNVAVAEHAQFFGLAGKTCSIQWRSYSK